MCARIVLCLCCLLLTLRPTSTQAAALTLLPPGHTWEYTFNDPSGDPSWKTSTGTGGTWSTGAAPFGNNPGGDPNFNPATIWPANARLWLRTPLDLTGIDLTTVAWDLGVDNGFELYANGTLIAASNAEGYTYRWEYSGAFGGSLIAGPNVLALALEDHGGATAFDMQVTGVRIPEPRSQILALGLLLSLLTTIRVRGNRMGLIFARNCVNRQTF